jgi:hypothetical protein
MNYWPKYYRRKKPKGNLDPISRLIVRTLGNDLKGFLKKTQGERTKHIKGTLAVLGDKELKNKPHYKVYANRLPSGLRRSDGGTFKPREWLYDLHWFADPGGYRLTSVPLVVECEWRWTRGKEDEQRPKDCYGAVKYDFQKLLVANAKLRLLIFKKRTERLGETTNDDLDKYFEETIQGYDHLTKDSKFLFVAFGHDCFWYSEKTKHDNEWRL